MLKGGRVEVGVWVSALRVFGYVMLRGRRIGGWGGGRR